METVELAYIEMVATMITRNTMHQNQRIAAIKELEAKENIVVPSTFSRELRKREVSHVVFNSQKETKMLPVNE